MGKDPTKSSENIYCKCRKRASTYNSKLYSREGASELLGISVSSLADYELGNTMPPVDKVTLMADLYDSPELRNHFCVNECPIGKTDIKKLEVKEVDRVTIELMHYFSKVPKIKEMLLEITADGVIEVGEEEDLKQVIEVLEFISKGAEELKLSLNKTKIK